MGTLYKRDGVYYANYLDRNGERHRRSTHTADVKVARARLRDLELATTDRGAHAATEALADSLDYFTDITCAGRSPGTVRCYTQKARHVARLLGDTLVDKLTRETVERYIAKRLEEKAHRHSVHKELVVLRGALAAARQRDRFHGPSDVVPHFESGYVPRTSYLTPDQFLALVPHLVPPLPERAKERTLAKRERLLQERALYCLLIAFASPRRGELEALRWEHIDLGRNLIHLPKGKTVGRPIAIHEVLRPWLEALALDSGPVVTPWANVGRDLPRACERAGVPRVTPNDLRRTFASWLIQAGVSNRIVARLLGHNTTRMVDLVYGQLDDATLAAAITRLPRCDAGETHAVPRPGTTGAGGTSAASLAIVNSVEESFASTSCVVPRDGVEPPTRGFSGLRDMGSQIASKVSDRKRKLVSVR